MYVCVYVCMYVCMYVWIYLSTGPLAPKRQTYIASPIAFFICLNHTYIHTPYCRVGPQGFSIPSSSIIIIIIIMTSIVYFEKLCLIDTDTHTKTHDEHIPKHIHTKMTSSFHPCHILDFWTDLPTYLME